MNLLELQVHNLQQCNNFSFNVGLSANEVAESVYENNVITLLNDALASEMMSVLRYRSHYFMAKGIYTKMITDSFLFFSCEKQAHADRIARRIVQLGGVPDFTPQNLLKHVHNEYTGGDSLMDMIVESVVAESIAITRYRELIQYIGDNDPVTTHWLTTTIAEAEERLEDLDGFMGSVSQAC